MNDRQSPALKAEKFENTVKAGMKLHASWGYSMTMNDYCQVIEVSKTGKTVKCRMVKTVMNHAVYSGDGSGRAHSGSEMVGPVFRLKVTKNGYNNEPDFHGSYPFCGADDLPIDTKMSDCSSRMGYFTPDHGGESYENHMD